MTRGCFIAHKFIKLKIRLAPPLISVVYVSPLRRVYVDN
jgi:hypothetical protein